MTADTKLDQLVRDEFKHILPSIIWQNDDDNYEVFDRYQLVVKDRSCAVYINEDIQGIFSSTRTAISWCIADKYRRYNLARDILLFDNMLNTVSNDIFVRAGVAESSRSEWLKDTVEIKLESKLIKKRKLKNQIDKCVNWAKYLHQKGFENETSRPGTATKVKTNISRV